MCPPDTPASAARATIKPLGGTGQGKQGRLRWHWPIRRTGSAFAWMLCLFLALPFAGGAQKKGAKPAKNNKEVLQARREKLLADINRTRQELEDIRSQKSANLAGLTALQQQIASRQQIISIYGQQLKQTTTEIAGASRQIADLAADLLQLKASYARLIRQAQKNRIGYQPYVFILSAHSFNDAWLRLRHLQQLTAQRKQRAEEIVATQAQLRQKKLELSAQVKTKRRLLGDEQHQKTALVGDANERTQIIQKLSANEQALQDDLEAKRAAADRLTHAIEEVIKQQARPADGPRGSTHPAPGLARTPETEKLSGEFGANRGRLPWPVAEAALAETFGTHPHPVLKGVMVKNDGINIRTRPGSAVKSLFRGTVTGVVSIPGMQRAIIVRHGQYLTVFAHLESVAVKMGQIVAQGQTLGTVHTDLDDHKTELHLEIWKNMEKTNPVGWLKRR